MGLLSDDSFLGYRVGFQNNFWFLFSLYFTFYLLFLHDSQHQIYISSSLLPIYIFQIISLWKHPALEDFETIMRFDSDSCFKSINKYLPNFAHDRLVYHSQFVGYEAGGETFVKGLYPFVHQYIHDKNIKIRNPLLWQFISTSWESKGFLPLYNTNFEVSSKSFMQRKDVTAFHESLTEKPPYGVLTHRYVVIHRFLLGCFFFNHNSSILTHRVYTVCCLPFLTIQLAIFYLKDGEMPS